MECGLNPDAVIDEINKKTPLNTLVFSREIKCKKQCDDFILLLLEYGAHFDTSVKKLTVMDKYKMKYRCGIFNVVKQPQNYLKLQCLAARSIRTHALHYEDILCKKLCDFVRMH